MIRSEKSDKLNLSTRQEWTITLSNILVNLVSGYQICGRDYSAGKKLENLE